MWHPQSWYPKHSHPWPFTPGMYAQIQVPSTPNNTQVGTGASYVYIHSVHNGTWPKATGSAALSRGWTVVEADICASDRYILTNQYSIINPLLWWNMNTCKPLTLTSLFAPPSTCIAFSFYTTNSWVGCTNQSFTIISSLKPCQISKVSCAE